MRRAHLLWAAMLLIPVALAVLAGCGKQEPSKTPPPPSSGKTDMKSAPAPEKNDTKKDDAKSDETSAADIKQKTCPVMVGNPINPKIYVDYKGQRIYFCCAMCPPQFNADPEKYMPNVRAQLEGRTIEKSSEHEGHMH